MPDRIEIRENGLSFDVNLATGQKTGWFLDQRENRAAAAAYAPGRTVLDAFCNAGGFGLCAARAGAVSVLSVDSSEAAVAQVRENARRKRSGRQGRGPGGQRLRLPAGPGKGGAALRPRRAGPARLRQEPGRPGGAARGYKEINLRALRLLESGGVLVTCSCSWWFDREKFRAMLEDAAADAGRRLRYLEDRGQAPDHPIVSGYPESRYLKCVIGETVDGGQVNGSGLRTRLHASLERRYRLALSSFPFTVHRPPSASQHQRLRDLVLLHPEEALELVHGPVLRAGGAVVEGPELLDLLVLAGPEGRGEGGPATGPPPPVHGY
ncbi:MAG: class I SAM-dependent methyltransferase [Desulfobacterales bacterium]|nr:class I SAM-dependent methyltransferase [Desulfobacterales bacterium]